MAKWFKDCLVNFWNCVPARILQMAFNFRYWSRSFLVHLTLFVYMSTLSSKLFFGILSLRRCLLCPFFVVFELNILFFTSSLKDYLTEGHSKPTSHSPCCLPICWPRQRYLEQMVLRSPMQNCNIFHLRKFRMLWMFSKPLLRSIQIITMVNDRIVLSWNWEEKLISG